MTRDLPVKLKTEEAERSPFSYDDRCATRETAGSITAQMARVRRSKFTTKVKMLWAEFF